MERAEREAHYLRNARYILGRTFWDRRVCALFNHDIRYYQAEELMRTEFYDAEWRNESLNDTFTIVSTISGGIYKGYETVLQTSALLKRYAGFNFRWIVIGYDKSNKFVKMAENYTRLKSSECNIELAGRLDAKRMLEILLSAHVYCHVSHKENSPNAVCEALLLGIPTIASYAGGTATLTKGDESEALLYQDGDAHLLAGSVIDVHDNFEEYAEKGKLARKSALYRHDKERVGESYVEIYKDIISDFNK